MLMHAVYVSDTVSVSVSVTGLPMGGVPVAVAVFMIGPGRSPSITVCVLVPVVVAPGLSVVVPRVMGESVKLHPLVVILGVLVGAATWGILGALLAAPVIASGREIVSYLYRHIIGEKPFPPAGPEPDRKEISLMEKIDEFKDRAGELVQRIPGVEKESTNYVKPVSEKTVEDQSGELMESGEGRQGDIPRRDIEG